MPLRSRGPRHVSAIATSLSGITMPRFRNGRALKSAEPTCRPVSVKSKIWSACLPCGNPYQRGARLGLGARSVVRGPAINTWSLSVQTKTLSFGQGLIMRTPRTNVTAHSGTDNFFVTPFSLNDKHFLTKQRFDSLYPLLSLQLHSHLSLFYLRSPAS